MFTAPSDLSAPLFTHWLYWADSELAHITPQPAQPGVWHLRLSAASVGRSNVPVSAPPAGLRAKDVEMGTVTGVVLWAVVHTRNCPSQPLAFNACMGRVAHGRWVSDQGQQRAWWPLHWPGEPGTLPSSGAGNLELTFSQGGTLQWHLAALRVELPPDAVFRESMAC